MKFFASLRKAIRLAETVDVSRIAVDEEYRQRVVKALG